MEITQLAPSQVDKAPGLRISDRPERLAGLLILAVAFGGFGIWASLAPIDSAVVAPGIVNVESSRKTVQHLEGGIVREILVREGDSVQEGDVLFRLDDTEARAQLEIVRSQFLALRAQEARLVAERDQEDAIHFPTDLLEASEDPRVDEAITGQRRVFDARRKSMEGEVAVLEQRVGQLQEQIRGLEGLAESKLRRIGLYQEEIAGLEKLFAKGLGDSARLREWERLVAELEGERAEHQSAIAAARVQIGETELQIVQVRRHFITEVVTELREVQTKLSDLRERTRALEKTVERTVIHAPVGGAVVAMSVHTEGGVIKPGERILDVVPRGESLIVEARVQPNDIDRVHPGLEAELRLTAFNSRTTPTVPGHVLTVSGDRLTDPATHLPYYLARLQVTQQGMDTLKDRTLLPGMPADVMIMTGERTFFEYLVRPITDRLARAFKEE